MTCRCVGDGSGRKVLGVIRKQKSGLGWDPLGLPNHHAYPICLMTGQTKSPGWWAVFPLK